MTTYICVVLLQVESYYISFCNPLYSLNTPWMCVHGLKIDIPHFFNGYTVLYCMDILYFI